MVLIGGFLSVVDWWSSSRVLAGGFLSVFDRWRSLRVMFGGFPSMVDYSRTSGCWIPLSAELGSLVI